MRGAGAGHEFSLNCFPRRLKQEEQLSKKLVEQENFREIATDK